MQENLKNEDEILEELILKYSKDGKLKCGVSFKIADKTGIDIEKVGKKANEMGIRINECELGQFGKFRYEISSSNPENLAKLEPLLDEKRRIFCKDAREIASSGVGLKSIRATLRESNIDVKYCQLGCFKEKKGKKMEVKLKIWIENSDGELLFGKGKTEVLDTIDKVGSIKKASEVLDMNYKKCWTHLKILEKNFGEELFETRQGGGENAGTTLKPKAHKLIEAYKILEKDVAEFTEKRFKELFLKKDK